MPTSSLFKTGLLAVAAGLITTAASAQLTTDLDVSLGGTGWYDSYGSSIGGNYFTGNDGTGTLYRNYFVFDRSALTNIQVTKATLEIFLPSSFDFGTTYFSSNPDDTGALFSVYKFGGDVTSLAENSGGVAAFNDLGTDVNGSFGSTNVSSANNVLGSSVTLNLSGYFLDYFNGLSGKFALGGALSDLDNNAGPDDFEYMFGWTENMQTAATLHLEFIAVPEPSTYGLMGAAGLLGLVAWRRRAARKS